MDRRGLDRTAIDIESDFMSAEARPMLRLTGFPGRKLGRQI